MATCSICNIEFYPLKISIKTCSKECAKKRTSDLHKQWQQDNKEKSCSYSKKSSSKKLLSSENLLKNMEI